MSEPTSPAEPARPVEPVTPVTPARPARPVEPVTPEPIEPGGYLPLNQRVFGSDIDSDEEIPPAIGGPLDYSAGRGLFGNPSSDEIDRDTSVDEPARTRLDFGSDGEFALSEYSKYMPKHIREKCVIPDEIKAMRPTISDQVEVYDVIAMEEKTIKQHLEEVEEEGEEGEEGEIPDKVIFMNQTKNQFVAYDRDNISKFINVEPEQGAISGIFYKCKQMSNDVEVKPNDVEYNRPYFDLSKIGYIPGGYVDLLCMINIAQPQFGFPRPRVFMVVEPETPIAINPVANELTIRTHRYQTTTIKKTTWFDGKPDETHTKTEYSGDLNSLGMHIDDFGAAHCQEGQYSKLVYLVPVEVTSAEGPSAEEEEEEIRKLLEEEEEEIRKLLESEEGPVPSAEEPVPSAEEPVPSAEEPVPSRAPGGADQRGGKRKRKGKKTLRKKNLLKKKKNKTKRKKSKKNKKSKK